MTAVMRANLIAVMLVFPVAALAHGGISAIGALGALLPIYIALWALSFLMIVWFFYCVAMFMLSATSVTPRKQTIFKVYSYILAGVFILLAFGSTLIFAWPILLATGFMAAFVIVITRLILTRNEGRMAAS